MPRERLAYSPLAPSQQLSPIGAIATPPETCDEMLAIWISRSTPPGALRHGCSRSSAPSRPGLGVIDKEVVHRS